MMGMIDIIAGLGWDPEIRGLLTVALGLAVLAGSVWLLLVTNTGTRLGSLIALAGFWGWLFVMGIFWWIYGIGWAGSLPTWEVQDVFIDAPGAEVEGLQEAFVGNVDDLPDGNCFNGDIFPLADGVGSMSLDATSTRWALCTPRAIALVSAYPSAERESIIRQLLNPQGENSKVDRVVNRLFGTPMAEPQEMLNALTSSQRDEVFDELVRFRTEELRQGVIDSNDFLGPDDPRYIEGDALAVAQDEAVANAMLRIDDISLSQLEALAPQVNEWAEQAGLIRLSGWNLQSTSQSGEAAATADAFLRNELFPDGDFLVLDAFQQGGKDKRTGSGLWDRVSHKVSSTAQITHPTNYTVVNVQQTVEKIADPSKPPPVPEIDPDQPTYSVVMTRNLGNLRLIPGLFTIVSLILFLLTCLVLHWRDLGLREKGFES
ncbi:MAG: hypothetical protein QMB08_07465 [Acidimicrobiales bacterium]|jgi:hypothetical protein